MMPPARWTREGGPLERDLVTRELADLLSALAHRERIRIVEELRDGELDVNHLADAVDCRSARVSQHLSLLRTHRLVRMRRDGRHVFYSLTNPDLARWLCEGLKFLESELLADAHLHEAVEAVRDAWTAPADDVASR